MKDVPFATQLPIELRDMLVSTGILNSDYTPNEDTAERLGWILRGPEDPEYPAIFKDVKSNADHQLANAPNSDDRKQLLTGDTLPQ